MRGFLFAGGRYGGVKMALDPAWDPKHSRRGAGTRISSETVRLGV